MNVMYQTKTDHFELIDLAQRVMDGSGEVIHTTSVITSGGNRAAEMMSGFSSQEVAMLWALVRSTHNADRHFKLLHLWLTSAMRVAIADAGVKFTVQSVKQVASGVSHAALTQYLFNKGRCKKCTGLGSAKTISGRLIECESCAGSGMARYKLAERHRLSGLTIARQSYIQTCERFELAALDVLAAWRIGLDQRLHMYFYTERQAALRDLQN